MLERHILPTNVYLRGASVLYVRTLFAHAEGTIKAAQPILPCKQQIRRDPRRWSRLTIQSG
jgi:hypothetical protein